MEVFKGIDDSMILIDDTKVYLRPSLESGQGAVIERDVCDFSEIYMFYYGEDSDNDHGMLYTVLIYTTSIIENKNYYIVFDNQTDAKKLYNVLLEKAPHANPANFE